MSLEFAVQYPCRLRARYAEKHLRAWGRLASIHARVTTGEAGVPTAEAVRFVEESDDEIQRISKETFVCLRCPAHLPLEAAGEGESVGCLGRVTYPVEAVFEKFLADRVQLCLDTIEELDRPRLLHIFLDPDSPFDGEATKHLRRITETNGLRFFELRLPVKLAGAAAALTTDNLFDLLAGFTSADTSLTTYQREFPLAAASDYFDFLHLLLRHESTADERSRIAARSRNYLQFTRLLAALERAESLRARVLID